MQTMTKLKPTHTRALSLAQHNCGSHSNILNTVQDNIWFCADINRPQRTQVVFGGPNVAGTSNTMHLHQLLGKYQYQSVSLDHKSLTLVILWPLFIVTVRLTFAVCKGFSSTTIGFFGINSGTYICVPLRVDFQFSSVRYAFFLHFHREWCPWKVNHTVPVLSALAWYQPELNRTLKGGWLDPLQSADWST